MEEQTTNSNYPQQIAPHNFNKKLLFLGIGAIIIFVLGFLAGNVTLGIKTYNTQQSQKISSSHSANQSKVSSIPSPSLSEISISPVPSQTIPSG